MAGGPGRWRNDKYYRIVTCYCLTHRLAQPNDFLLGRGTGERESSGGRAEGKRREPREGEGWCTI